MVDGASDGELANCASDPVSASGSLSDSTCVSDRVFDLTVSLDSESEILSVSCRTSQLICGVSQTFLLINNTKNWHGSDASHVGAQENASEGGA